MPIERKSYYEHFHAPPISPEEFEARPQVLFLGQYSTGKTSMVQWLANRKTAYFDIRPQPSTDKFMAIVHGDEEQLINGNAATCLPQLPYQGLSSFGSGLLSNFQAVSMPSDILRDITFIDTPGVLSGSKQRIGRDYDFPSVTSWMAERADLILLAFDAHKLDISDEFQEVMEVLKPQANKVRCVLNKADQIDATNLVRVYGALLWNVGKVLQTPEVARVYISSFWDEEYRYKDHKVLFDEDKQALLKELYGLPRNALLRKINEFVARVRKVRAHLCLVSHLKSQLPWLQMKFGRDTQLRTWLDERLCTLFDDAQRQRGLNAGDMPVLESFRRSLASFDHATRLPDWQAKDVARLDKLIDHDIPALMADVGGISVVPLSCREAPQPQPSRSIMERVVGKRKREDAAS
jgi:EH domain-containing protein 1